MPSVDAIRADFLINVGRTDDARNLLDSALKADPNSVQAHETMGTLELRAGHRDEAKKWYGEAVTLDPQDYLAQYHFGLLSMTDSSDPDAAEKSFLAAIHVNPRFAPAYDALASVYRKRHEKLDEALKLNLQAVKLDPASVVFRINGAWTLILLGRYDDAFSVMHTAQTMARTPQELGMVEATLKQMEKQKAQLQP